MHAIELSKVSKRFTVKKKGVVDAVRDLSLTIAQGEVFGFLGPNGAGKSTTIKMLMGLIRPSEGHAFILGQDVSSPLSRKHVGYLPENPAFYEYLSAREYLGFVGETFGMNRNVLQEKIESILSVLDLRDAANRPVRGYSKGMVQRLGLAQALIHDPDIYVLDEPMSGLDPIGRALVKQIILELKGKGKSVFFSTHITSDVEAVCDRVGIIFQGALRQVRQVDSIMAEGIMGYQVRIRESGGSQPSERYVPKDDFPQFMKEAVGTGMEISLIEPKRKDLESFFLDIVKESTC